MLTLDIESKKIEDGAPLLPEPVGVALRWQDGKSAYLAWGHPDGNNCTKDQAKQILARHWSEEILTHNGCGFDIPDLCHHLGLPLRNPLLTHDTLFAAYLHNPHARSLSLKDLSNDWLGIAPDEQQDMYDWIMANVPDCRSRKLCGAYISETPVSISGPYAIGDVDRTWALWEHLLPLISPMQEAYDRERILSPILSEIQNKGVRVDVERLRADTVEATRRKHELDRLIREHLAAPPEFNPGSDKELAAIMMERGYSGFLTTPTGRVSMNKESLERALSGDLKLKSLLHSRSTYDTLIGTFMLPWLAYADANNGRIHASYNQVRNPDGYGTRTGRLSSSKPNFQNVPKDLGNDYFDLPFPVMRSYLLPEEGHVWVCGDFKNQEPRLTAHYEDDAFKRAFIENPLLDPYMFVANMCHIERHPAKQILLGLIYAMGAASLADKIGCSLEQANIYRNIVKSQLAGVVELDQDCKRRFKKGLPIKTLGGRLYYCEPPSNGRTWDYKALNTLIQGSAADQCKQSLIYMDVAMNPSRYQQFGGIFEPMVEETFRKWGEGAMRGLESSGARLLGTVHDEISLSCRAEHVDLINEIMQSAANNLVCDVPMIMDIDSGPNWSEAKP